MEFSSFSPVVPLSLGTHPSATPASRCFDSPPPVRSYGVFVGMALAEVSPFCWRSFPLSGISLFDGSFFFFFFFAQGRFSPRPASSPGSFLPPPSLGRFLFTMDAPPQSPSPFFLVAFRGTTLGVLSCALVTRRGFQRTSPKALLPRISLPSPVPPFSTSYGSFFLQKCLSYRLAAFALLEWPRFMPASDKGMVLRHVLTRGLPVFGHWSS